MVFGGIFIIWVFFFATVSLSLLRIITSRDSESPRKFSGTQLLKPTINWIFVYRLSSFAQIVVILEVSGSKPNKFVVRFFKILFSLNNWSTLTYVTDIGFFFLEKNFVRLSVHLCLKLNFPWLVAEYSYLSSSFTKGLAFVLCIICTSYCILMGVWSGTIEECSFSLLGNLE